MSKRTITAEIKAENRQLKQKLGESKREVGGFSSMVKKAGVAMMAAFTAKKVLSGIKDLIIGLGQMADRLLDLEAMTGINVIKLQEFEYVAKVAGVSADTLGRAMDGLTRRMGNATSENSPLNRALAQLGIEARDVTGALRDGSDIFDDALLALSEMENVTERNVLAQQLFGGGWKDLAPIMSMGAKNIEELRKEAHELGVVIDRDALEKANQLREGTVRLQESTEALKREMGMEFIPVLIRLSEVGMDAFRTFREMRNQLELLDQNVGGIRGAWAKLVTVFGGTPDVIDDAIRATYKEIQAMDEAIKKAEERGVVEHEEIQSLIRDRNRLAGMIGQELKWTDHLIDRRRGAADASLEGVDAMGEQAKQLGQIGRLDEEIAEAKEQFIQANSDAERTAALLRLGELEREKKELEDIAQLRASITRMGLDMGETPGGMERMEPVGVEGPDIERQLEGLERHAEALDKIRENANAARESMVDWQQVSTSAASAVGVAFGQMATESGKAVSDIIKQLLAQVTGQLIASIMTSLPFPANIAVAGGAGAMAGALFGQIHAFADGAKVTGPTLAMFGEYPGARSNPEYALRQDQLLSIVGGKKGETVARFEGGWSEMFIRLKEQERRMGNV